MNYIRYISILSGFFLSMISSTRAQDHSLFSIDSLRSQAQSAYFPGVMTELQSSVGEGTVDSSFRVKASQLFSLPDTSNWTDKIKSRLALPIIRKSNPLLLTGGSISYNYNFRSAADTPFFESNISQHFIVANLNAVVADQVPVRVSYFQRETNSAYWRDVRQFRVELNTSEFNRLSTQRLRERLTMKLQDFSNPFMRPVIESIFNRKMQLSDWLKSDAVVNRYTEAKMFVTNSYDSVSTAHYDSLYQKAEEFLDFYDRMKVASSKLNAYYDSLQNEYRSRVSKVQSIQRLMKGHSLTPTQIEELKSFLSAHGLMDRSTEKLIENIYAIKSLAVGRTFPQVSDLTIRNVNVNGINFLYNRGRLIIGVTAGTVDFRVRDFISKTKSRSPQFVYLGQLGYGKVDGNHVIVSYFKGRKQLLTTGTKAALASITGASVKGRLLVRRSHSFEVELAQSASPALLPVSGQSDKPSLSFSDPNSRAWSLGYRGYFSPTRTRIKAQYRQAGINYQQFSGFRVNATTQQWNIAASQPLFKSRLLINASLRKNDFENQIIPQRFTSNMLFKQLSLTYRNRRGSSLSVAYLPSSQLTVVDQEVYENLYQVFNLQAFHRYDVGESAMSTMIMFNQFYNDSRDSGLLYYNSKNWYLAQHVDFPAFSSDFNVSYSDNPSYNLVAAETRIYKDIRNGLRLGFGIKLSHLDSDRTRVGFNTASRLRIGKLGDLTLSLEKTYLPGSSNQLIKNEFYNLGFTRFF